jgi:hypothetical protein
MLQDKLPVVRLAKDKNRRSSRHGIIITRRGDGMRYHWLAHHLVQAWFPQLAKETRDQIVSEAVCRAWCTFLDLDYRLMRSCVTAAAQKKGLVPLQENSPPSVPVQTGIPRNGSLHRAAVIQMSDYR